MEDAHAQAAAVIAAANTVAVVGHIHPDADAIGSVCAMVAALRRRGIDAVGVIGQTQPFSANLCAIPGAKEIQCVSELPGVDAAVVVDCASLERTGTCAAGLVQLGENLVVVDHHASNPGFGAINLIDPEAESTTTVLLEWFKHLGVALDPALATALYAGLVTDTGNFRWGRQAMHMMAAELIAAGAHTHSIVAELMDARGVDDLSLMAAVLSTATIVAGNAVNVLALTAEYHTIKHHDPGTVESLVSLVQAPREAEVGALFKEYEPGEWSVSLRSASINVADVAKRFGGGGHVAAAGFSTSGDRMQVFAELMDVFNDR